MQSEIWIKVSLGNRNGILSGSTVKSAATEIKHLVSMRCTFKYHWNKWDLSTYAVWGCCRILNRIRSFSYRPPNNAWTQKAPQEYSDSCNIQQKLYVYFWIVPSHVTFANYVWKSWDFQSHFVKRHAGLLFQNPEISLHRVLMAWFSGELPCAHCPSLYQWDDAFEAVH